MSTRKRTGLASAPGFRTMLGAYWYYQGMTLGYRILYAYFPKNGAVFIAGLNSQPCRSAKVFKIMREAVADFLECDGDRLGVRHIGHPDLGAPHQTTLIRRSAVFYLVASPILFELVARTTVQVKSGAACLQAKVKRSRLPARTAMPIGITKEPNKRRRLQASLLPRTPNRLTIAFGSAGVGL
jgi:hypothetical protein